MKNQSTAGGSGNPVATQSDLQTRALIVALELLRHSITDLPLSRLTNAAEARGGGTGRNAFGAGDTSLDLSEATRRLQLDEIRDERRRKAEDKEIADANRGFGGRAMQGAKGAAGDALGMLVGKFAAVLGPMTVLSQVVASNASGFQVLGTSMKLFAATVGPILLPVVATLAAGLIDLSERVWQDIAPCLEDFYQAVVESLLPAVRWMVDAFAEAARFFNDPMGYVADKVFNGDTANAVNNIAAGVSGDTGEGDFSGDTGAGGSFDTGAGKYGRSTGGGGDYGEGGAALPTTSTGGKPGSLAIVAQELRRSLGPQAQFAGLSQISKNAQLSAMNSSPIEQMVLQRLAKAVEALERVEVNTRKDSSRFSGDF